MRVRSVLAVGAVLALLLSGCSRGQEANDSLPTATSSVAAEATLEPLGPADFPVPDEAREQTAAGVAAFATYYLDLADFLLPTLDAEPLRQLSDGCEACTQLADGYEADRAAAYSYEGGDITIESMGAPSAANGRGEVAFILSQAEVAVLDQTGQPVPGRQSAPSRLSGGMAVSWDPGRSSWIATQLTADPI